ncbi:unnamed protein product [Owenia fusiformis]|uniref:Acyltransferase n=1 Tax=Owenia fusiformis TaxID=6347 RepID=A0A8J1Y0V5_OWEFU|nr:unnamed protein product [Owenia fusiformis]
MKVLGIEFAPLNIPLHRRLETLAVLQWTLCFLGLGFGCLFLSIYVLFHTKYYWIVLLYLPWYYYDRMTPTNGGNQNAWVRRWRVWRYFCNYFPIKLHKTAELPPDKNYILGYHPHGIMSVGGFGNFATEGTGFASIFPGLTARLLILRGQFMFPFYRDYLMLSGVVDCSKESLEWHLTKEGTGNASVLVVGGAVEALRARPNTNTINLKNRKGFIKIALKHGASLVPVFSFGENDVFDQVPNPEGSFLFNLQQKMTRICGFSMPIIQGRGVFNYTFGILPFRRPVNTVVGAPIDVEKCSNPSQEQIDKLHAQYVTSLMKLYDDHKDKYSNNTSTLEII